METLTLNSSYTEPFNLEDNDLSEIRKMFSSLFKQNNEANEDLILLFEKYDQIPTKCQDLFSHIINVHELWLNRITNVHDGDVKPWRALSKIDFTLRNEDNYYITLGLLASESYGKNYNWNFIYTNHEGIQIQTNLTDAYFHILSHSVYHRGQIAYILKQNGIALPDTQFSILKNSHSTF
jgi:uncharacterized damage-inducible protein DinB